MSSHQQKEILKLTNISSLYFFAINSIIKKPNNKDISKLLVPLVEDFDNQDFDLLRMLSQVGNKWGYEIFDDSYRPRLTGLNKYSHVQKILQKTALDYINSILSKANIEYRVISSFYSDQIKHSDNYYLINFKNYYLVQKRFVKRFLELLKSDSNITLLSVNKLNQYQIVVCKYKKVTFEIVITSKIHTKNFNSVLWNDKSTICKQNLDELNMICNFQKFYFAMPIWTRSSWARSWMFNFCLQIEEINLHKLLEFAKICDVINPMLAVLEYLIKSGIDNEKILSGFNNYADSAYKNWVKKYLSYIDIFNTGNNNLKETIKWKITDIKVFGLDLPQLISNFYYYNFRKEK